MGPRDRRIRFVVWPLLGLIAAGVVVHAVSTLGPKPSEFHHLGAHWIYYGVLAASAIAVLLRAVLVKADRLAWLLIGIGAASWAAADIVYALAYTDLKS